MFGGAALGGFHSDVLNATPEDEEATLRLVEELKNRAKNSLKSKNYPEAIELYSKGIEVSPSNAILFANRSMCRLGMGNNTEALTDAEKALELDSGYVKAYYRKGAALMALKRAREAKEAFERGLSLAPEDKELLQQLHKVNEELKKKDSNSSSSVPMDITPSSSSSAAKSTSSTGTKLATPSKNASPNKASKEVPVEEEESGEVYRGYKKTADGKTTTFFNNELDDATRALIGNIAPKKIDQPMEINGNGVGSAWNAAGTVETVSHTPWALRRVEELLETLQVDLPKDYSVAVVKVKSVTGDVEVLLVRGKRKNVYDLNVELEWALRDADDKTLAKGTMSVTDISADLDTEFAVTVDRSVGTSSPETNDLMRSHVQSSKQGLQPAVLKAIGNFVEELKLK